MFKINERNHLMLRDQVYNVLNKDYKEMSKNLFYHCSLSRYGRSDGLYKNGVYLFYALNGPSVLYAESRDIKLKDEAECDHPLDLEKGRFYFYQDASVKLRKLIDITCNELKDHLCALILHKIDPIECGIIRKERLLEEKYKQIESNWLS